MENPICDTIFDSRNLIEYKEYLKDELLNMFNEFMKDKDKDWEEEDSFKGIDFNQEYFAKVYKDEIVEYNEFSDFYDELSGSPDFVYGETIIHEDYWETYCEDLLVDCGYISKNFPSWIEIDWEATSNNMSQDYTIVSYKSEDYYIRA